MSEISVLSNQYDQLAGTSNKVNHSVIALKKRNLIRGASGRADYPNLAVSEEEEGSARETLLDFLRNVLKILAEDSVTSEFVPPLALADYKAKLISQPYMEEDIKEIVGRISSGEDLRSGDLQVLDKILSILDGERSMLFRKLRKARG